MSTNAFGKVEGIQWARIRKMPPMISVFLSMCAFQAECKAKIEERIRPDIPSSYPHLPTETL